MWPSFRLPVSSRHQDLSVSPSQSRTPPKCRKDLKQWVQLFNWKRWVSSSAQEHKDLWKPSKPCHVGTHWKALAEFSQIRVPICQGFSDFSGFLHYFLLAKLATNSIRVNYSTGELGYDGRNGTRKIGPSYAKSVVYIWQTLDMHRTGTKHIVRHMQKSVVQWSVISKFTCILQRIAYLNIIEN